MNKNDNSLLDFGYSAAEESRELKQLWQRMTQWKLPVAILGTILAFVGVVLTSILTLESLRRYNQYNDFDWNPFGSERMQNQRFAELCFASALLFVGIILLIIFGYLFLARNSAAKYLNGQPLATVIPSQINYWRTAAIGLIAAMAILIAVSSYAFYLTTRRFDAVSEPPMIDIQRPPSTVDTGFVAPIEESPVEVAPAEVEAVPTEEAPPERLDNFN